MIVFNTNPEGSNPIMITCGEWNVDQNGGPAKPQHVVSVPPGHGVDLIFLGLLTHEEKLMEAKLKGKKSD